MNVKQRRNAEWLACLFVLVAILGSVLFGTTFHIVAGPPPGTRPVHRFWSNQLGSHFYTIDPNEKAKLTTHYGHVWIYEGVAFYAWPDPNSLEVRR